MHDEAAVQASVLLVDDNPANLLALEALLEPLGHRLVKARSGSEALKGLLDQDFALILMDVMMPGMDGFQTVALIKERQKSISVPVIFVSAMAKEAMQIARGYSYGAVDYITKPFDGEILKAKVSVLVALSQQADRIIKQRELLLKQEHELKVKEVQRVAMQTASRAKDQFLAMVSHELRAPLNAILGWTEMLSSGRLTAEETSDALATIQRNAEMQTRLVEDLIDVSRIVAGKARLQLADVELTHVVRAACDTVRHRAEEKHVGIEIEPFEGEDRIRGDFQRLVQIVVNLLTNAIKYTAKGGYVNVALRHDQDRFLLVVRDTGVGMTKEFMRHAFEPFTQDTSHAPELGGLGLGLAIARHLIELHKGTIAIDSDGEGKGTRVTVTLPARS